MKKTLFFLLFMPIAFVVKAQNVAINNTGLSANASAILDASSTNKGLLIPRMSKAQKNAIPTPAAGLLLYQNTPDSIGFHYYDGTKWLWLAASNSIDTIAWKATGNTGTTTTNHFIGTKDNVPLSFRQNDKWLGRLDATAKNYFIGAGSGANSIGGNNVAIGDSGLTSNRTGSNNISIGSNALLKAINAYATIGIGSAALGNNASNDIFNNNINGAIAVGDSAGNNIKGSEGVFLGRNAARSYISSFGYRSVVVGAYAGDTSVANNSVVIGAETGRKNVANGNVFIGSESGQKNTTGINCFVGDNSGRDNTTGTQNTYMGYYSSAASNGNDNVAFGYASLGSNKISNNNTAVGSGSLISSQGNSNTGVGKDAGRKIVFGTNNTFLGAFADANLTNLNNASAIGANARVDVSNAMVLGSINGVNGATASTNVGIGTTNPLATLDVNGGIRTRYSGTVIRPVVAGLQLVGIPVSPALPAGWDFTNTMVLVSIVDGTTGTIYQTKLVSATQINVDMNGNFTGPTRFNYIIFKL